MKKSFWNNSHDQQAQYEELYDKLVPSCGPADSLAGEVLRAASNLYHDYYNNGLGNNKSGELEFAKKHLKLVDYDVLEDAVNYGNESSYFHDERLINALERLAEDAIAFAAKAENQEKENNEDCQDYGISCGEMDRLRGYYDCPECGYHESECCCDDEDY